MLRLSCDPFVRLALGQMHQLQSAGSDEWKQMLQASMPCDCLQMQGVDISSIWQALCSKIIQHHWSEARSFGGAKGNPVKP